MAIKKAGGGSYVPTEKEWSLRQSILILHQQSVSHMKVVMFFFHGEVAEAISLASAGLQIDRWQHQRKSESKILDSEIF